MNGAVGNSTTLLEALPNFGSIAAEADFRPEFFVHSDAWQAVRDRERCVVVGRKGTGKTALGLGLFEERFAESRFLASWLRFSDYPWEVHEMVRNNQLGRTTRFVETWQFLIHVELAKFAIADQGGRESGGRAAACAELEKFLKETWGELSFHFRDTFKPTNYKVTKSFKPSAAGFSFGGVDWENVPRGTLGPKLRTMNEWLQMMLVESLQPNTEYFLVFDDLDMDMDLSNAQYLDCMIGLVRAAGATDIWARRHQVEASAVVLMRNDLYGILRFADKTKFSDSRVERLTWTEEGSGPSSLKQILNARVAVLAEAAGISVDPAVTDWWSEIFSGAEVEAGKDIFEFMVERSYRRPRDLIKFCNLALECARQRWAKTDEKGGWLQIEPDDVLAALPAYSAYMREELGAETFPHFDPMDQWLELLTRVGSPTFTSKDFEAEVKRSTDLTDEATGTAILQAFFRFSVIGCSARKGDVADWRSYFWAHEETPRAFDPRTPAFLVHPGLQSTLGLAV